MKKEEEEGKYQSSEKVTISISPIYEIIYLLERRKWRKKEGKGRRIYLYIYINRDVWRKCLSQSPISVDINLSEGKEEEENRRKQENINQHRNGRRRWLDPLTSEADGKVWRGILKMATEKWRHGGGSGRRQKNRLSLIIIKKASPCHCLPDEQAGAHQPLCPMPASCRLPTSSSLLLLPACALRALPATRLQLFARRALSSCLSPENNMLIEWIMKRRRWRERRIINEKAYIHNDGNMPSVILLASLSSSIGDNRKQSEK